jgi:hypothetical protein
MGKDSKAKKSATKTASAVGKKKAVKKKSEVAKKTTDQSHIVEVKGSKGNTYIVNLAKKTCTCGGFVYRGKCKHVGEEWNRHYGWLHKIRGNCAIDVLDASSGFATFEDVPMPEAKPGDHTKSGVPLTILIGDGFRKFRKGPYAKCCVCEGLWLYDAGLDNKGKPCDCVCMANPETETFCMDNWQPNFDDYMCNKDEMFSDKELHLVLQETVCCERDNFFSIDDRKSPLPPCTTRFVVKNLDHDDNSALKIAEERFSDQEKQRYYYSYTLCTTCVNHVNQVRPLFCFDCVKLFKSEKEMKKHQDNVHWM